MFGNISSGLIWVQSVCKVYQQTPLGRNDLSSLHLIIKNSEYDQEILQSQTVWELQ